MSQQQNYDVVIIGAGMSGMYQLYLLRNLGFSVRVFETGTDVGGTWYWNRYPGARFDSESYSYGYSFSKEVLDEWEWSEHFSAQPETLQYLNYIADKFDIRKDIQFGARVVGAVFQEEENNWNITLQDGCQATAQFMITAVGPISAPVMPNIEGRNDFLGEAYHTGLWPHEPVSFVDKRVAVIGTGATGVQTIQEVAKTVGHLTVFQRSPNYCAPLHNSPIDAETQEKIKASYPKIFEKCAISHGAFMHDADPRYALDVSEEERKAFYEQRYMEPGFGIWMGNFRDIFVNQHANDTISEFVKSKIRERVDDPEVAEKLIPRDHGFGTRRVPLETNYYEAYNQANVLLVDIKDTPIKKITTTGLSCGGQDYQFDMIIYATGFDAVTGGFDRIDIRGLGGLRLKEKWQNGPRTYLGLQVESFPNMFTLVGPHNAASFCNIPRCIEQNVEWVANLLSYLKERNIKRIAPTLAAENEWTDHVNEVASKLLFTKVDSWFTGINKNIAGKDQRTSLLYAGGAPSYKQRCDEVASNDYVGFMMQ